MKQRKTRSKRNVSGDCKKGKSIFACKTTQKEVSSEATKTDCMNHGYRIIRTLGEGAYAKVKLAEVSASRLARNEEMSIKSEFTDGELQVAIKVISKTAIPKEFLLKFLPREVENHSRLPDHPHVVRVFDHFSTHGHVYLVMEYCKNGDLLDLINNHIGTNQKGIGEELSRKLFRQICEGLLHIHSNNIVHRDLKCENVLLDENMDAKLTDFGFSATVEDPKAMLRTSCGSYAYTAPEVIRNKPYEGFKADIWSLGIMLFAMINGRLPFNDAQILDMEEDMKMQRLRFERSATFDCMVLIRKLLQYHPLERPCLDDIINDPWLCGKKPIPRQVQRAKINPYPGRKPGEKEVSTIVHTPTEVIELPASMRNNTICYRQDLSPRAYNDSLTGTVTVKQKDGETVTLKSRTGRSFGKKIEVPAVCNRPATWPRSKTGSPELKKPTNKPRTQTQYQHTGADIRNVARLIVDKYKQGETIPSNSKEVPKQVPLWLLNQVLNSEGVQTDHEKIALLGKQVPAHSPYCSPSETPNQESRPSTGCPACAIKSMSTPSGSEKENQHNPANNQKKSKTTLRKSANGSYMSSTPSVGDIPPSPTPYDCQSPTLRKQRIGYTSPIPIKKTEERNSMRASDPQYCYEKELVPQVSGLRLGPERSTSTRATKVSSGFKFKVMTPASRAHMCRERKMQAYTNQAFHQAIWPLPLVHGTNLPMNRSPPKPRPTPRDKNPNANPRDSKPTAKSEDDGRCMTIGGTVKPRHTLVVHVAS